MFIFSCRFWRPQASRWLFWEPPSLGQSGGRLLFWYLDAFLWLRRAFRTIATKSNYKSCFFFSGLMLWYLHSRFRLILEGWIVYCKSLDLAPCLPKYDALFFKLTFVRKSLIPCLQVVLSGFASIYFEKVVKSTTEVVSIWERNFQLGIYSILIYGSIIVYENLNGSPDAPNP